MTKKLAVALIALALASCFGRVSAWASAPGDAHACCRGEAPAPASAPALTECCAPPAAVGAVMVVRAEMIAILVESAALPPALVLTEAAGESAPPGPQTLLSAVPARAPPLA